MDAGGAHGIRAGVDRGLESPTGENSFRRLRAAGSPRPAGAYSGFTPSRMTGRPARPNWIFASGTISSSPAS